MFCFRRLGPMRRAAAAAWSVKPQAISIKLEPANLRSQNLCRGNHTSAAIDAKQLFGQRSSVFREIRSFGSLRSSSLSGGKSVNGAEQQMSPWDEVEAQRPLAPDPYDGTYQMPKGAPDPRNLSRQQFHQFMHGKPQRFSKELKVGLFSTFFVVQSAYLRGASQLLVRRRSRDDRVHAWS